jgi:hypothetical protein
LRVLLLPEHFVEHRVEVGFWLRRFWLFFDGLRGRKINKVGLLELLLRAVVCRLGFA